MYLDDLMSYDIWMHYETNYQVGCKLSHFCLKSQTIPHMDGSINRNRDILKASHANINLLNIILTY